MSKPLLLVLGAVHVRHQYLRAAVQSLCAIPGYETHVFLFQDRATQKVDRECRWLQEHMRYGDHWVWCFPGPAIVTDRESPEVWQTARNFYLTTSLLHLERRPTFVSVWDDDMVLADPKGAAEALTDADLVYGPKVFLWDDPTTRNTRFEHNSVAFFRYRDGDRFPTDRIIHATEKVHDDPKSRRKSLTIPILDYGFLSERDRVEVFDRAKRAGKLDGYTLPIVDEPLLERLPQALAEASREIARGFRP